MLVIISNEHSEAKPASPLPKIEFDQMNGCHSMLEPQLHSKDGWSHFYGLNSEPYSFVTNLNIIILAICVAVSLLINFKREKEQQQKNASHYYPLCNYAVCKYEPKPL